MTAAPSAIPCREVLETERLRLEPVVEAHAKALFEDLRSGRIYRVLMDLGPLRLRDLRARFREVERSGADGGELCLQWAAWARADRRYVGLFEASIGEGGRADLGYLVFPRSSRRGYALEACRRIVRHLFEDRRVPSVVVITAAKNRPARALAERLGLRPAPPGSTPGAGDGEALAWYALERPLAATPDLHDR